MGLLIPSPMLALGAPAQPGQQAPGWTTLPMILAMLGIFYFLLIRPQRNKEKAHAQLLKTIRPGDKIVTTSGIVGVIVNVKDKTISIRSADAKFEITKAAVAEITERSGETSQ